MVYPLSQYTGEMQTTDWSQAPTYPGADVTSGEHETKWVVPERFFDELPELLAKVPPRPGEEALYSWFKSLLASANESNEIADLLRGVAAGTDSTLVQELFEFRNIGIPLAGNWTTQRNGAAFGTDYLARTAMAKANILVNTPNETTYFYLDLDQSGQRLNGSNSYSITFAAGELPPDPPWVCWRLV